MVKRDKVMRWVLQEKKILNIIKPKELQHMGMLLNLPNRKYVNEPKFLNKAYY